MAEQFTTITADGTFLEHKVDGECSVFVHGTFGGGTISVERQCTDGQYRTIPEAVFTANTNKLLRFAQRAKNTLRFVMSGATSPSVFVEFYP